MALESRGRRVVRFFADWGHRYPLWETGTDKYTMEPSDYGFSEQLADRLERWVSHWVDNFDEITGWKSSAAAEESRRQGDALIEDLNAEASSSVEIRDERRV